MYFSTSYKFILSSHSILFWGVGVHWVLMWLLTCRGLYKCLMPDYACRCQTNTLIMVPINFWRNYDTFIKKEIFLDQKLTELEHFLKISKNFKVNLSNTDQQFLKQSIDYNDFLQPSNIANLSPFSNFPYMYHLPRLQSFEINTPLIFDIIFPIWG